MATSVTPPTGGWPAWVVGGIVALLGIVLGLGGVWLASLGGSWYYVIAGAALIVSGVQLVRARVSGAWWYAAVLAGTLAWTVWEVGRSYWGYVPRLGLFVVLAVPVALVLPRLVGGASRRVALGLVALLAVVFFGAFALAFLPHNAYRSERAAAAADADTSQAQRVGATRSNADDLPAARVDASERAASLASARAASERVASFASDPAASFTGQPARDATESTDEVRDSSESTLARAEGTPPASDSVLPAVTPDPADWAAYGRSHSATRYSPLDRIDRTNVGRLERAWVYRTGDMPVRGLNKWAAETTPLAIDGVLYLCTAMNDIVALDAATGEALWTFDANVSTDSIPYSASCRGVAYHEATRLPEGAECRRRVIEGTLDARLIAVDATNGRPCSQFGTNGEIDLTVGMGETYPGYVAVTSPPTIVRGVVVVNHQVLDGQRRDAPSGVIRGYDVVSGELVWAWDMLRPDRKGVPPAGEEYSRGTPNSWTIAAGDEALGLVYMPMGNSSGDYYNGSRTQVEKEHSTAVVALDASTGDVRWVFQTVHDDVWDYDLGSQPSLVDFETDDGPVPALILPTKVGDIYVLDRATGEPLTDVEERPAPQGGAPGNELSATQPHSVDMPVLRRPTLTEQDTWGLTPLDHLLCRIQFRDASYEGMYTPPTLDRSWIQWPGYNGGNDWGSAAVDTERGILIANYTNIPMYNRLVTREEADEMGLVPLGVPGGSSESGGPQPMFGTPYGALIAPWRVEWTGAPCIAPPWGSITAIDLATREVLWDVPLGTARRNGPFGIPTHLPIQIGMPNNGGPIVTAGGVVFIAAATDDLLRAIDVDTGEVLWTDTLPAGGQATPMTYEADGEQYVAIVAGGHHFMETPAGDYVLAYKLP